MINIPESCTTVKYAAFWGCENVKQIKIPNSLTNIESSAFVRLKIENLEIPEGITSLPLDAFGICTNLKHVKLPESLTTLDRGVFYHCTSLKEITIPKNVTKIGEILFWECEKLEHIYNLSPIPQTIFPIHDAPSQITLHVPAGSAELYRKAFFWNLMNIVEIEN